MAQHGHQGEKEPRAHGETHHEDQVVDLNSASVEELAALPMIGEERARRLVEARPFKTWEEVEEVPGIGPGLVDDLRSGGAKVKGTLTRAFETILGQR